jgi:hypothetical protein
VTRSEQNANEIIVQLIDPREQVAPDYSTERVYFSYIVIIIILFPVLRRIHNLFQSKFSTENDLVLSFSICSILSFFKVIQWLLTSSSSSFHHFCLSFYLSFNNLSSMAIPTQNVTNPVSCLLFIVSKTFLFSFLPKLPYVALKITASSLQPLLGLTYNRKG